MFGAMGVIFATPMAVAVMAMVQHLYVEDTLENGRAKAKPGGRSLQKTA
jgi:predicted PurR-regulated permease PerM